MSPFLRLTTVLACGFLAVWSVAPRFSLTSLDVWNWPEAWGSLSRAQERATLLENFQGRLTHSYRAKRALGADLADGRLTLPEAVDKFRRLVADPARFSQALR